ncbi:hypothetical protein A3A93_03285 [Candidatus Roizmanbacteria bacterium RIFCSPLOWO2_01_FULL_38_12]|uniref:Peptidase M20 dimerisation domain-containing protein n=1 Tax=Candidatus Roizmanbacteria bacterium RIFCSPLOWO2_01_FULL_38_12 TaxID=1802061 RepID=A0A1F7ISN5_9BACT|nr:MAG: hypothetical protein A2861_03950 [Candidatus Roizmanbacteria bacterium RIFCSPHIGHO2_01_FULL_38_15]OGK35797.1 MAG: hypothetical protein A3F59_03575 [Candidatus Roizmanbacteria bacterium RIFCSPHIGHO2_12_FULL_38_13]OGK46370.1 MAG: hypothetical protein A3A93_03285 [Candidatus Roizmanbacteria bacterium RIFCSPLOWO2_01_FULL_38_12]
MEINPLDFIDDHFESIVKEIKTIASISSPPFEEEKKIKYLKEKVARYQFLKNISVDKEGNLSAFLHGKQNKNVLLVAHTDTALKVENNNISIKGNRIYGHGVCDNTSGVVALLTLLQFLEDGHITPAYNLIFLFTVGEEGIGGKRGMKYFLKHNRHITTVINVESHNVGRITTAAIGQFRAKIEVICDKGGHSWRDFGNPNAVCILANLITDLQKSDLFQKGETSYTFSLLDGGQSINVIPTSASVMYEFRSLSMMKFKKIHTLFNTTIRSYKKHYPESIVKIKIIADSLPVALGKNHPLITFTENIHKKLHITSFYKEGNADGDISLNLGIPTVTIGTSKGYNTHSVKEYVEKNSFKKGYAQLFYMITQLPSLPL